MPQEVVMPDIADTRFLIIATDGFEQSELFEPRARLLEEGAQVTLASPKLDPIQGMEHDQKGDTIRPDMTLDDVDPDQYDALILPGGVANPDTLRMNETAIDIVESFMESGKTVAAICHGPWLLAEADVLEGRTVTGWPSVRTDLFNAGANVVDQEVAVDGNLITSRKPDDIPAFVEAIKTAVTQAEAVPAS
jgi:protease I